MWVLGVQGEERGAVRGCSAWWRTFQGVESLCGQQGRERFLLVPRGSRLKVATGVHCIW